MDPGESPPPVREASQLAHADTTDLSNEVRLLSPADDDVPRYAGDDVLGRGGMGIVSLRHDQRIGRRVAMKRLRAEVANQPEARARFLREAQVQGQLQHPAVVPVYDLGVDDTGAPYFTMKQVRGTTLAAVIEGLADGDPTITAAYPPRRLLSAFATLCLAVDYAHERGVLHRDLKPANIMLGDYGEVYVLDWGLAKLRHDADAPPAEPVLIGDLHEAMTHVGSVMGTPGYVAPEQVTHDAQPPDRRVDVYSLGAILFEILALERFHPPGPVKQVIESTVRGADARVSVRAPEREVSPELDAICVRATAVAPADRYAHARELHDALQRFLEGERDLDLRRAKSTEHAEVATAALDRLRSTSGADAIDERRTAMRELGRALALDPENHHAIETMIQLLNVPMTSVPPEVEREMERGYRKRSRWIARVAVLVYASMFGFLPFCFWMGIRQPVLLTTCYVMLGVCVVLSVLSARARRPPTGLAVAALLCSSVSFGLVARFFGSLVLVPAAVAVNATAYAIFLDRRWRPLIVLASVSAIIVPLWLELAGTVARAYTFSDNGLLIRPMALGLPAAASLTLLLLTSVAAVLLGTLVVGHIRDRLSDAEERIYIYAWHLRELVPPSARPATDPTG